MTGLVCAGSGFGILVYSNEKLVLPAATLSTERRAAEHEENVYILLKIGSFAGAFRTRVTLCLVVHKVLDVFMIDAATSTLDRGSTARMFAALSTNVGLG